MTASRRRYRTDLTDAQWRILAPLIPAPKPGGRSAVHQRRELLNAMPYLVRAGCAWRLLPARSAALADPSTTTLCCWRLEGRWTRMRGGRRSSCCCRRLRWLAWRSHYGRRGRRAFVASYSRAWATRNLDDR